MIRTLSHSKLATAFLLAFFAVQSAHAADMNDLTPLPLDEISTFTRVFETIKNHYVDDVTDEKLLKDAIRGMISGLDPHSALLDSQEMSDIQSETTGKYGGLGIEITKENGGIRVVSPIDDTPAHQAGIQPGDIIVRLDNHPVDRMTLPEAVNIMRGKPGTEITLTIIRQGINTPLQITLTRAVIITRSVRSYFLEPNFGYLRITQFKTTTPELAREKIEELYDGSTSLDGLVLDLRNNPGGELRSAIGITDMFIDKGIIVKTRNRNGVTEQEYRATPGDALDGVPVVVLVNEGSASASEIVAGALQDHGRAVIMGKTTFGKGSVQTILPVDKTTAVKLTTHRYYTPADRSIQVEGIVPDIVVDRREIAEVKQEEISMLREGDLAGSLENENGAEPEPEINSNNSQVNSVVGNDYQLQQALNLLKGLRIARILKG